MALISDLLSRYTDFPTRLDTWEPKVNGRGRTSVTNAEHVNRLQAAIYQLQQYCQKLVRVVESGSVTGDRVCVRIQTTFYNDRSRAQVAYTVRLTEEQRALLGHDPFRTGNMVLVNVQRTDAGAGAGAHYRATYRPLPPDALELVIDNLDTGGAVAAGLYEIHVTFLGG